jgi:hypothetical protein
MRLAAEALDLKPPPSSVKEKLTMSLPRACCVVPLAIACMGIILLAAEDVTMTVTSSLSSLPVTCTSFCTLRREREASAGRQMHKCLICHKRTLRLDVVRATQIRNAQQHACNLLACVSWCALCSGCRGTPCQLQASEDILI